MTIQEAITEIKSKHKPYTYANPKISQQAYTIMLNRIEKGTAGDTAIMSFLNKFGYKTVISVTKCNLNNLY